MWPGSSPSALVNGASGMIIAAIVVIALYAGRDLLIPLALAGILSFILAPLVGGSPTEARRAVLRSRWW